MYLRATTLPPPQLLPHEPYVSQSDLYRILNIPDLEKSDMEHIIQSKEILATASQGKLELLMRNPRFRNWLAAPSSAELLIHGNSVALHVSPLSLFCSMLVQNLERMHRFRTVVFFCGRHIESSDPYAGGRGMIKSLIAQLLLQHTFDLSFCKPAFVALVERGDISASCALFAWLAGQMNKDVGLFCVIDGINFYEHGEYLDDMAVVLRSLLNQRQESGVHAAFKILVASPSITTDVRKAFHEQGILSMPARPQKGQNISALRFARHIEDCLKA